MKPPQKRVALFLLFTFLFASALLAQPANKNCANAILINSDTACVVATSQLDSKTPGSATSHGALISNLNSKNYKMYKEY